MTAPGPGHNGGQLQSFVSRIERLNEERTNLGTDITEVYKELAGAGFDKKIVRAIIRDRKLSTAARQERDALIDTYMQALGMLSDLPLGKAAIAAVK